MCELEQTRPTLHLHVHVASTRQGAQVSTSCTDVATFSRRPIFDDCAPLRQRSHTRAGVWRRSAAAALLKEQIESSESGKVLVTCEATGAGGLMIHHFLPTPVWTAS